MTDNFYDSEYNPRERIPNALEYFSRWQAESLRARNNLLASLNVAYGDTAEETLDFFPADKESAPLLVFLHGGYWRAMHKNDFSWIAPPFVKRGVSVAIVNYALAPQVSVEDIVAQIEGAIVWIHTNAQDLGIDPNRIVCSGHSAGGHLGAMLLATQWQSMSASLPKQPLRGVVTVSGIFDLEPLMKAEFLKQEIILSENAIHSLSPGNLEPTVDGDVVTVVGELESNEFHRQSALLAERWGASRVRGPLVIRKANHFDACDAYADAASEVFQSIISMCNE